jgi:hypothetical protein
MNNPVTGLAILVAMIVAEAWLGFAGALEQAGPDRAAVPARPGRRGYGLDRAHRRAVEHPPRGAGVGMLIGLAVGASGVAIYNGLRGSTRSTRRSRSAACSTC